jgi:hypothetical protein
LAPYLKDIQTLLLAICGYALIALALYAHVLPSRFQWSIMQKWWEPKFVPSSCQPQVRKGPADNKNKKKMARSHATIAQQYSHSVRSLEGGNNCYQEYKEHTTCQRLE